MRLTTENERLFDAQKKLVVETSEALNEAQIWFFNIVGIPNYEKPEDGATMIEENISEHLEIIQRVRKRANDTLDEMEKALLEKQKDGSSDTSLPA